jgi:hypothetical protein
VNQSSTSLQELPTEIKQEIFEHLPQSTLHQLTFINKHINQLVVPFLYKSFYQHGGDNSQLLQYFEITHSVPQLSGFLRNITVEGLPHTSQEQIRSALRCFGKDNWVRSRYTTGLHSHYFSHGPDLAVLFLLSSNPGVRSLRILQPSNPIRNGHGPLFLPIYLESFWGALVRNQPLPRWVDNLLSLELSLETISWHSITPLFRLPVLKKLVFNDGEGLDSASGDMADTYAMVSPRSSPIEILDFGTCYVSSGIVANAVSVCKTLRTCRFQRYMPDYKSQDCRLNSKLYEHQSTLQTLCMCCWDSMEELFVGSGLVKEFTALIHLDVHYYAVHCLDPEDLSLPPNLRSLTLCASSNDAEYVMKDLADLAPVLREKCDTVLPMTLQYVHLRKHYRVLPRLWKLPALFAKEGISFSLHVSLNTAGLSKYRTLCTFL